MTKQTIERAALNLATGTPGMCGFLPTPEGTVEYIGFNMRRPVRMLRLTVNDKTFTENNLPFYFIMQKGKPDRQAWAVLGDLDWQQLYSSQNSDARVSCLALVEPPSMLAEPQKEKTKIPVAVKALFHGEYGGVVVVRDDYDFCNLILAECSHAPLLDGHTVEDEK